MKTFTASSVMARLTAIILLTSSFILHPSSLLSQGFNYQAVVRGSDNLPLASQNVSFRFSILDAAQTAVYTEAQNTTTNALGMVNLVIGEADPVSFASIDWSAGGYSLKVEMDPAGGTSYTLSETRALQWVPYAKHSEKTAGIAGGKLEIMGDASQNDEEALFEVKRNDGQTVFAVYPDGVRVYVEDPAGKGSKGGFAVGGFDPTKGLTSEFLRVTPDSVRIYIEEGGGKGPKGGFAVGGFNPVKGLTSDYFSVSGKSTAEVYPGVPGVFWYPLKEAFLAGNVLVEHPDSVGTNSWVSGYRSKAIGNFSQALGYQAIAKGDYSTAIGKNAVANKRNAFALGENAMAKNEESYAFGRGAIAEGFRSFAFGSAGVDSAGSVTGVAYTKGAYSFAIGQGSQALGTGAFTMGIADTAKGNYSTSIGYKSASAGYGSTSMGYSCSANNHYATAIGNRAKAIGDRSLSIGNSTISEGNSSVALGHATYSGGVYSTAFGTGTKAIGTGSAAFGVQGQATGYASTSMGYETKAIGNYSTSTGFRTIASGDYSFTSGSQDTASGNYSVAMGSWTKASGDYAIAMGMYSQATSGNSISIGYQTLSSGSVSVAIGGSAKATGQVAVAIGAYVEANGHHTTALGFETIANGWYSTSLGCNTIALSGYETVIGRSNTTYTPVNSSGWNTNDRIFVIGNGDGPGARSNAMTVLKSGRIGLQSVTTPTYALELPNSSTTGVGQARAYDWAKYSDGRTKTERNPLQYGLEEVMQLEPQSYFHHSTTGNGNEIDIHTEGSYDIGLVAQEVYTIIPEAVNKPEDESKDLWSMSYDKLVPVLVRAIQEQQEIIDNQQSQINELKSLVYKLAEK